MVLRGRSHGVHSNLNFTGNLKFQSSSSAQAPPGPRVDRDCEVLMSAAHRGWPPLAGGGLQVVVSVLVFPSRSDLLLRAQSTISLGSGKWHSAWVEHIQDASGRSAAVESSTSESESRVGAGVRGSSSQLCPCPLLPTGVVCPSCSVQSGTHTALAGAHE